MAPRLHILVCAISTLCLIGLAVSADPGFPTLNDIIVVSYTTEVQVTDQVVQDTVYAKEVYDSIENSGKLYLKILGTINQVYYYEDTNEILEVNATTCLVWKVDESVYGVTDIFYGWRSLKPLVIGPSALLFYAQTRRGDIKYNGTKTIRDIPACDAFHLSITSKEDKINIFYYFAPANWTSPYQLEGLRIPIRIHVVGKSSKYTQGAEWVDIDIINDYAYFKPIIDSPSELQPAIGLGCMLRTKTDIFPDIPKTFQYSAELVDLNETSENDDVKFERLWYDENRRIARYDVYQKTKSLRSFQDYNTGVMFNFKNNMGCEIGPIVNAYFETDDENLEGRFKTSKEVLHFDGEFYEMGTRQISGLTCDVYESVEYNYFYDNQRHHRFVVTAFFVEDSVMESRIPAVIMLTGWKSTREMSFQKQYNISDFSDTIYPEMYANLGLEKCFPKTDSKSYFVLIMQTSSDISAQMESQDDIIVAELKRQIVKYADIPDWRIAVFKIDYKPSMVLGTGLILDRPPPLMQFEWFGKNDHKTKDKNLRIVDAETSTDCADACIDAEEGCTGFYFCNGGCFLKSEDMTETHKEDEDTWDLGICDEYIRVQKETTNAHNTPLKEALKNLETAVQNQDIFVEFYIKDGEEIIKVVDIVIGDPYTVPDPVFPTLEDIKVAAYTTEVQVTDQVMQDTSYARELYDFIKHSGKLYLINEGATNQVYYYNDTSEILEVNDTRCMVYKSNESDYGLTDVFYGWRNLKPLVIGPSALLFYAQTRRGDIKYNGTKTIRDIPGCDAFYLNITNKEEKINIIYYFSPANWTTPYQMKGLRVPIRIHVVGKSSRNLAGAHWEDIDIINDYAYFKPTIDSPSELQPALGLGCKFRTKTDSFPYIPKTFKYSAEVVDLLEASRNYKFDSKFERKKIAFKSGRTLKRNHCQKMDILKRDLLDWSSAC